MKVLEMKKKEKIEPMYLTGLTIMKFTALIGHPVTHTTSGLPMVPNELYRIDEHGITVV